METYDYRMNNDILNQGSSQIEKLSKKEFLKLIETAKEIKQSDEKKQFENATAYFNNAILPTMKEFAEMSSALLTIEKNDNMQTIIASFQCSYGFDITENCRLLKSWFIAANHIGITLENGEPTLSLIFDCNELC